MDTPEPGPTAPDRPRRETAGAPPRLRRQGLPAVTRSAVAAARAAMQAAALSEPEQRATGLLIGIRYGRAELVEQGRALSRGLDFRDYCDPGAFVHSMTSAVAGQIAIDCGTCGPAAVVNTGDRSGLDAVGLAHQMLVSRGTGLFLAGGADSAEAMAVMGSGGRPEARTLAALLVLQGAEDAADDPSAIRLVSYRSTAMPGQEDVVRDVLRQAQVPWTALTAVAVCGLSQAPAAALRSACARRGVAMSAVEDSVGWTGGAGGAFAVTLAAQALRQAPPDRQGAALALSAAGGRCSWLVLRAGRGPGETGAALPGKGAGDVH